MNAIPRNWSSPEPNRPKKVALALLVATGQASGRFDYLDELTTQGVVVTIAGDRTSCPLCGRFVGRPAVRNALRLMHVAWEYLDDLEPHSFIVDGDNVVFQRSSRWRSRGSGKTVQFESIWHIVLEGDLVKEYTLFLDTAVLATFEK